MPAIDARCVRKVVIRRLCRRLSLRLAGNEANFVLYDHRTEKRGATKTNVLSDFSRGAPEDPFYGAQLIEIERASMARAQMAAAAAPSMNAPTTAAMAAFASAKKCRPARFGACTASAASSVLIQVILG
jgi:hypothetical protein